MDTTSCRCVWTRGHAVIRRLAALSPGFGVALLAWPAAASAHAFELGREDVPIPVYVFIWGAAGILVLSFIALSVLWRRTQFEDERWRPLPPALSRWLTHPATEIVAGAIGVGLLGVVVWSGFFGVNVPIVNFSVTFVWISFWLGGVFASVLFGNVYRALNPWRAIARFVAFMLSGSLGRRLSPPFSYPERLGRWPAAVGLVAFVWMELISGVNGSGVTPHATAIATLVYNLYTFCGMTLFGIERWVSRADTFSVYFAMFSELSPLEMRGNRLGIRRPLSGVTRWARVPGSIAVVVATLGATVFDGAHDGALQRPIATVYEHFTRLGLSLGSAARIADTLFLVGVIAAVALIFWIGVRGMETVEGSPALSQLGTRFVHSLIPAQVRSL